MAFAAAYRSGRSLEGEPPGLSYHVQFEARLSLTGSRADRRWAVAPGDLGHVLRHLAQRVAAKAGEAMPAEVPCPVDEGMLDDLAVRLWAARGRSLVVSGSQDVAVQVLCNTINHLLGNYGATLDVARGALHRQDDDRALEILLQELEAGQVSALFVAGCNPVADLPQGAQLAEAIRAVPLAVSLADRVDETAEVCQYVCPDHHALETWGDAEVMSGALSLFQPAIRPLGNTRSMLESLWTWAGQPRTDREAVQAYWRQAVYPRQSQAHDFHAFWDRSVHDGVAAVSPEMAPVKPFNRAGIGAVGSPITARDGAFSLVLYAKVGLPDGRHAHNPWLQELPDPISKATWDNYACVSPMGAQTLGLEPGDVVRMETADGRVLSLPALIQPGQHDGVVAVALGYGRRGTERFAHVGPRWIEARPTVGADGRIGKNAAHLLVFAEGALRYDQAVVRMIKTGERRDLARSQEYHSHVAPEHLTPPSGGVRPMVQETTLLAFVADPGAGAPPTHPIEGELWPEDHPYKGHHWGMAIDLNACTGCSACVVACQAENNVPVVGKDEVRRNREMHWIRIDRYHSESDEGVETAYQPMLCQQCDHAPCETVCPVLATVHSKEGLNEQVYNRCIGTRYCANNCPYKARRFNWFDYPREDRLQNMVLNPDVTVRSRGVMEKCTFCVQRIQAARIAARAEGMAIADGDIQPACQQTCPAQAIVFGDMNDPESHVSQWMNQPRAYRVLEELNVRPRTSYLARLRNPAELSDHSAGERPEKELQTDQGEAS